MFHLPGRFDAVDLPNRIKATVLFLRALTTVKFVITFAVSKFLQEISLRTEVVSVADMKYHFVQMRLAKLIEAFVPLIFPALETNVLKYSYTYIQISSFFF